MRHQEPDDDEIDLGEYVRLLWRHRLLIAASALACAVLAIGVGLSTKRTYETETSLVVSRAKIGEPGVDAAAATTANLRPFVENRQVAARVIQEFGLATPPYNMSPTTFFGSVIAIDEVRGSTIMLLRGTLDDPSLITRVVNRVAEIAVETAREASQQEALRARDDIKVQVDESRARMEEAEARLRTFLETSQIELLRRDVNAQLGQRESLLDLLVGIESEKARLATAERELGTRQRTDTVRRSIDSDPDLLEAARKATSQPGELLNLELRDESLNPVYQTLDQQIADSRTQLAVMEQKKSQLVDVRKLGGAQLATLNDLYHKESELSRLEVERDLTRRIYIDMATSYERARLQVAGRSSEIQIIAPAIQPDRPMSRNVARNALIALMAGLTLAVLGVLMYGAFSTDQRKAPI